MRDPAKIYRLEPDGPRPTDPVLVVVLDGFVDAGSAGRLAVRTLLADKEPRRVARFDVDRLIDYRSRRPPLRFESDHWASYDPPVLDVVAVTDLAGTEYLLLAGPEPDAQWERFCAAVEQLVEALGVRLTVNVTGIPMAVPHTRPIGVTAHGTRVELVADAVRWFTTAEVPGSAAALMEFRLGEAGHDAMGFAAHVPHYLARAEFPQAARILLDHLAVATGLVFDTEPLTVAAERTTAEIDAQVAGSEEVAQVVAALEQQYDAVAAGQAESGELGRILGGSIPSADELGAEVERFLAGQPERPDAPDHRDERPDGP